MAIFSKKAKVKQALPDDIVLPKHIGIIMDGNGRWAKKRGLPRTAGHSAGSSTFKKIARYCSDIGIKYLTVYAFSTENWRRPAEEIESLMKIFKSYMLEAIRDFKDDTVVVRFIGDTSKFSRELQDLMKETEQGSKDRTGMVLNIAVNYGGRAEIVTAIKKMYGEVKSGALDIDNIDEQTVSNHLYTAGQPDPDLIIRPSGEYRTSNFLLWQSAYSEYVIMDDVLWPDFTKEDINSAIIEYSKRNRRYGGV
ncbi:MAG: isoprenyl transferase [Clostridiales bacterium]|nr:isoprenyl transferase [Clostridiales bacterium]